MKLCTKCKTEKEEQHFSPGSPWCKQCRREAMADRKRRLIVSGKPYIRPERAKTEVEEKLLTAEGWEKFWPLVKEVDFLLFFDLSQSVGLRANETLALTKSSFNFEQGTVKIKTLKQKRGSPIHILPVRPDILQYIQTLDRETLFSFPADRARRKFKKYANLANLNPRLSLHSFRHLCATRLHEAGIDIQEIGEILRHKPQQGSTSYYIHSAVSRLKETLMKGWEKQTWIWKEPDK